MNVSPAENLLKAIERPLRYVASADPKRLHSVKNLSAHIFDLSRRALSLNLSDHEVHLFRGLQELFSGFESLKEDEKRNRISNALFLISPGHKTDISILFKEEDHPILDLEKVKESYKKLGKSLQYIKGVGPAIAVKFSHVGMNTIGDLLMFFPIRYEDRRTITPIRDLSQGVQSTVIGEILFSGVAFYKGLRRRIYEVVVCDDTGELKLKWFHFPLGGMENRMKRGQKLVISGKPRIYRSRFEMHHPDYEVQTRQMDSLSFGRIVSIYSEVGGLYQKTLRKILNVVVPTYGKERVCVIPPHICKKIDLLPPWRIISELHHPLSVPVPERRLQLERTLVFEELFFYCLSLVLQKRVLEKKVGISFCAPTPRVEKLIRSLPFKLTTAQEHVLATIRKDMASSTSMNRLLQGDVGSGKTVVAMLASLIAIDHAFQAAFLVPTEILAEQHFRTLSKWGELVGIRVGILLGKHSSLEKGKILHGILNGEFDLIVGTHAIFEAQVQFKQLGIVIVDEQHRFGVRQRAQLREKGREPDVLVMSATPIPRTLALTLYGDLDVSILDQVPSGRKPIETRLFEERDRSKVYEKVRGEIAKGKQAYVVYPLVESSENLDAKDATSMAEIFQKEVFPECRVALIHGQMPGLQKEETMNRFVKREVDILVSTTVIEVGIDVANATMIVIEHPERFGLSQLHQLRGRVGRGGEKSYCMLICPPKVSGAVRSRLKMFEKIHDGFKLAEEDLNIRGPGDFFGVAQSGLPPFSVATFPRDLSLLELARREALDLVEKDETLTHKEHQHLSWLLREMWSDRLQLVRVG